MKEQQQTEANTQELSQLMGIIFGEFANLEITEELNKNLEEFKKSDKWSNVNTCLGYHPMTPKGILSTEQWNNFHRLRKLEKVQDRYNVLAKEKEKEEEKKRQEQRQQEEMFERQQEEQRQQIIQIRQRQQESFEESVRMRMNNLYQ